MRYGVSLSKSFLSLERTSHVVIYNGGVRCSGNTSHHPINKLIWKPNSSIRYFTKGHSR